MNLNDGRVVLSEEVSRIVNRVASGRGKKPASVVPKPAKRIKKAEDIETGTAPEIRQDIRRWLASEAARIASGGLPTIKYFDIGPDDARAFRATQENNRDSNEGSIEQLSEKMKAGEWANTPESIWFSIRQQMVNGKHRTASVIRADCVVKIALSVVDDAAWAAGDDTTRRNAAHRLTIHFGVKNAKAKCSWYAPSEYLPKGSWSSGPKYTVIMDWINSVPEAVAWGEKIHVQFKKARGEWSKAPTMGALVYAYSRARTAKQRARIDRFTRDLFMRVNDQANRPLTMLQTYLAKASKGPKHKEDRRVVGSKALHALQLYMTGQFARSLLADEGAVDWFESNCPQPKQKT